MKAMKAVVAMKTKKEMKKKEEMETVWRCCKKTWPAMGYHGEWLADLQWLREQAKVLETWLVPVRIPYRRKRKAAKKATKAMKAMAAKAERAGRKGRESRE